MKKVLIAGGSGVIGRILAKGLSPEFQVAVLDKERCEDGFESYQADASSYPDLVKQIPNDTDVLVNLLAVKIKHDVLDIDEFEKMTDVFYRASYYLCRAAVELGIKKVTLPAAIMLQMFTKKTAAHCWAGKLQHRIIRNQKICTVY
ncbi:YtbQ [Bacillus atrophaeus UCMB-5137]|nr:YtbQ [Bacillus atrophaeus UCMB-5137]